MKKSLFLIVLLFASSMIFGQEARGTIFDQNNDPLIGAYIIHMKSDHHAHANEKGIFILNEVSEGDTLHISHLGFENLKYVVQDLTSDIDIVLKESVFELGEIVIGQNIKRTNIISYIDNQTSAVNSSQEILQKVPGLFIGQHAGGGKAEQIFLRGFDIDHGTDINIRVDGMPGNMVSHSHGQGYADLHFVIPETVDFVDFGKGPYYSDKGNFATAGYVEYKTKDALENSSINLEVGRFNTFRSVALLNLVNSDDHKAYIASEYLLSDGPFESPQNFQRANFFGKVSSKINKNNTLSILASHFSSKWDASGQVPVRAIENGSISRFGAIDDTEGGETSRTNIALNYSTTLSDRSFLKHSVYYSKYQFELFSNFTFFLNDPVNGDQITQRENRDLFGVESSWNKAFTTDMSDLFLQIGVGARNDIIKDNELSRTMNRRDVLERIRFGNVDESNIFGFADLEIDFGKLLIQPALRWDLFNFSYADHLANTFERKVKRKSTFSPKLNLIYNVDQNVQIFLKSGVGFHSNDSRVVLNQEVQSSVPLAYGADLGTVLKPRKRIVFNAALWYLFLEQEFVYVGDEGIVEPSGRTQRQGIDLGLRYQLTDRLFLNGDYNYAYARSIDDPEGENLIPLAPVHTSSAGLNYKGKNINASYRFRFLGDRSANEDYTIVAEGYAIHDLNASYSWQDITLGFAIENLFNQEWNETQFATESRLAFETESVEEIHLTPGTPFFIKGILKYNF